MLEFPEPDLDDPAAYRGYATRFFRDAAGNAYQVYLKRAEGRVVVVWANGANESLGFTLREPAGRPVFVAWGAPVARVAASGATRSVAFELRLPDPGADLGHVWLGSMRVERDLQHAGRHLEPFDSVPFVPTELREMVAALRRLPDTERARHLAALRAARVADVEARLRPVRTPFRRDTLAGVRIEQVTADGRNRLVLEVAVDARRAEIALAPDRVRLRARGGGPLDLWIRTETDVPALRALARDEIFDDAFLRALEAAAAERARLDARPEIRIPGTPEHARWLELRRLERQVRGAELLSYEEKLMAGLPNFATYFGRDMFMTALLMEPIWRPEMLERVVGAALRKLNPEGEVSHEEAVGGQAIRENAAEYARLVDAALARAADGSRAAADSLLAEARALLVDLQRTRENYLMRDDDLQLPVVAARWLAHPRLAPERTRAFLLGSARPGGPSRLALLLRNLAYVSEITAAYVRDPVPANLVPFPPLDDGWFPGSWRDSRAGYAGGRYAMDVNAIWAPHALAAIGEIRDRLHALGLDDDAWGAAAPRALDGPLGTYLRNPAALDSAVRIWRGAARHFRVELAPPEIRRRVEAYLAWLPPDEARYWHGVLARTRADREALRFLALSLDGQGRPIPVANTDPATAVALAGRAADPARVLAEIDVILRPYPVGLFVAGLGPLAANDAYAHPEVWERYRRDTYHSPRVVWGREVNLFLFGLAQAIERAAAAGGQSPTPDPARRARALRAGLDSVRTAVAASGLEHHELWSYEIENGTLRPVRYGTSTDVQLWNLTDLAVEYLVNRLPNP